MYPKSFLTPKLVSWDSDELLAGDCSAAPPTSSVRSQQSPAALRSMNVTVSSERLSFRSWMLYYFVSVRKVVCHSQAGQPQEVA